MRHPHPLLILAACLLALAATACNRPAAPAADAEAPAVAADPTSARADDAQATPPAATAPASETDDYVLTMPHVDALFAAQGHLAAAAQADPALEDAIAMNASEEDGLQYAARLEADPTLRAAIAKAGMSTRDYALTSEALFAALMAEGALASGLLKELPEGLNPQNVEFVRSHKAELQARLQAMGAGG